MGTQTMENSRESISRQGSVYSLTLNEVENHLGAPLHSMNLNDLLRNVVLDMDTSTARYDLNQQGNGGMNRALSKKTVDEVWKVIQQEKSIQGRSMNRTLGEMTLEDFLENAAMVAEDDNGSGFVENGNFGFAEQPLPPAAVVAAPVHWMRQTGAVMSTKKGRKRGIRMDDDDKTVERRQKRMIKNRESAARSRARKQAYTNELENKVSQLEEEIEMFRKQKELDSLLFSAAPPQDQKHHLRRSNSASF